MAERARTRAKPVAGGIDPAMLESAASAADLAVVEIVSWLSTELLPGVTDGGEKVARLPRGKPSQTRETGASNWESGFTPIVKLALWPAAIVFGFA